MYFRLYPLFFSVSDENYDKAAFLVLTKIRASLADQIKKRFPQATDLEKNTLIKEGVDHILKNEGNKFRDSIDKIAKDLEKANPRSKRVPYLLEADPYNFYRLTQNITETGTISSEIKGSKYFNDLMLAPLGHWEPLTLHPYAGFALYKFLALFSPSISLMYAVSFTPLFISALALIFFFLTCHLLECSVLSSLIASLFFTLSPIFLKRSAFGWYDNDPYNILFPLAILSALFLGINRRNNLKSCLFFAILCAFLISLYALFWQGWVYILAIIFTSSIALLLYSHYALRNRQETQNLLWFLSVVNIGCFISVSAAFGINDFFVLFQEGWKALKNFLTPQLTSWPDLYISVGELRKASLSEAIQMIGNLFFIATGLIGFIASTGSALRHPQKTDAYKHIVLAIFFLSCAFLAWGAQRFIILFLVPLSIFFALGLSICHQSLKLFFERLRFVKNPILPIVSFCIVLSFLAVTVRDAHNALIVWRPIFNDTWNKALLRIKEKTPKESIINSWWPPGHFITAIAKRRVTFDGATINNPQAYWLANVFLSPDERYSAGILRMLNNSANQAAEYLQNCGIKLSVAVEKLKEICQLNRPSAQATLKNLLNFKQTSGLLALTHRNPPPAYVLVYNDFIEKNLELSFVGKWNFKAIEEIQGDKKRLAKLPPRNSGEYIRFLWDLAGGPYLSSEILPQIGKKSNMVFLANNVTVNLSDMTCRIASQKFGNGIPLSIIYLDDKGEIAEKKLDNATLGVSLLFYKDGGLYSGVLADKRLAKSLLFRLYFFDGRGLKYFKPFIKEKDPAGRTTVLVFQVDWDQFKKDLNEQ